MNDDKKTWPPINQNFKDEDYPKFVEFSSPNYESINGALSEMGSQFHRSSDHLEYLSKILLTQNITDFQITQKKSPEIIYTCFHFKNGKDMIAFAALCTPLQQQDTIDVFDNPDFPVSLEAHKQVAEEFCDEFGIFARIKKAKDENGNKQLVFTFQNAVDAHAYLTARNSERNFINNRAHKIDTEMRKAETATDQNTSAAPDLK